jgi:hypothetical protein
MDLTYLRFLSVGGLLVVGLLTTVGAIVISLLVTGLVQAGFAAAGWLARSRSRRTEVEGRATVTSKTPAVDASFGRDARAAHELLARQAWWRLRC